MKRQSNVSEKGVQTQVGETTMQYVYQTSRKNHKELLIEKYKMARKRQRGSRPSFINALFYPPILKTSVYTFKLH